MFYLLFWNDFLQKGTTGFTRQVRSFIHRSAMYPFNQVDNMGIDPRVLKKYCPHRAAIERVNNVNSEWRDVMAVIVINTPMATDYEFVSMFES